MSENTDCSYIGRPWPRLSALFRAKQKHPATLIGRRWRTIHYADTPGLVGDLFAVIPQQFNCVLLRVSCRQGRIGPEADVMVLGLNDQESPIQSLPGPVVMPSYIKNFLALSKEPKYPSSLTFHCYRNGDLWESSDRFMPFDEGIDG